MIEIPEFVEARSALHRRLAAERAERFGRPIHGAEFDDLSMLETPDDPPAPPMQFHIIYESAALELSGRCVTLRRLRKEFEEVRLTVFCHYRRAMRTFIASRIAEATDLATGEVFEDALGYFMHHPLLQHETADQIAALSAEILAVNECRDEIILLSFLAAADGRIDDAEEDEMVKHVFNRCPDEALSEREVRRRVRSFVPDEWAFERALSRMCAGGGDARTLVRTMRHLVDADGRLDPEEVRFATAIEGELRAAGRV